MHIMFLEDLFHVRDFSRVSSQFHILRLCVEDPVEKSREVAAV